MSDANPRTVEPAAKIADVSSSILVTTITITTSPTTSAAAITSQTVRYDVNPATSGKLAKSINQLLRKAGVCVVDTSGSNARKTSSPIGVDLKDAESGRKEQAKNQDDMSQSELPSESKREGENE